MSQKVITSPNICDEEINENISVTMVNKWMKTDIVIQLIELNIFPVNVIKVVLTKRFFEVRKPYTSFAHLYEAVSEQREKACF